MNASSARQTNPADPTVPNDDPGVVPHHPVPPSSLPQPSLKPMKSPARPPRHRRQRLILLLCPTVDHRLQLRNEGTHCQTHRNTPVRCPYALSLPSSAVEMSFRRSLHVLQLPAYLNPLQLPFYGPHLSSHLRALYHHVLTGPKILRRCQPHLSCIHHHGISQL
jgi:hypothetical protein